MNDYRIIQTDNKKDFTDSINQVLSQGYILIGGINVMFVPDGSAWYAQAVAKPNDDKQLEKEKPSYSDFH